MRSPEQTSPDNNRIDFEAFPVRVPMTRRGKRVLRSIVPVLLLCVLAVDRMGWVPSGVTALTRDDRQRYHNKQFVVTRVVDGDSLDIAVADLTKDSETTRIRLWGVDTPETNRSPSGEAYYGPEASAFARQRCEGKRVRVMLEPHEETRGYYGRLLAYVVLPDGRMLNETLIRRGYGYADPRFDHAYKERFLELEKAARRDQAGFWQAVRPEQWPKWRQRRYGGK